MIPERFPQGEVALDFTEGKLFLLFDLREDPTETRLADRCRPAELASVVVNVMWPKTALLPP
jgi:hypothetical protein